MKSDKIYEAVSKVYKGRGLTKNEFNLRLKWAGEMADGMKPKVAAGWVYALKGEALEGNIELNEFKKIKERLKKES